MFTLSSEKIDPESLRKELEDFKAGSFVCFEGRVRNHNEGKAVASLEYEAYDALCKREAKKIELELRNRFDILEVKCFHRVGHLSLGDLAVWVGVISKHRDEGFKACRYTIDELKKRLPIWKKEHYVNEPATWVNCQACSHASINQLDESVYYSRQKKVSWVSDLKEKSVLVIGAGGLGASALQHLAGAGVGKIQICDFDEVSLSNLHRQVLFNIYDLGKNKAIAAKERLEKLNPFIKIESFPLPFSERTAKEYLESIDLVLECSDDIETKFLAHDLCASLGIPLVQASVFQTEGVLRVYLFASHSKQGCLRCLYPDVPSVDGVKTCSESGVIGVTPGVLGTLQSSMAIQVLSGVGRDEGEYLVDLFDLSIKKHSVPRRENCKVCEDVGEGKIARRVFEDEEKDVEVMPEDLLGLRMNDVEWIDVRSVDERKLLEGWEKEFLFFNDQMELLEHLKKSKKKAILVCEKGVRAKGLAIELRKQGIEKVQYFLGRRSKLKNKFTPYQN